LVTKFNAGRSISEIPGHSAEKHSSGSSKAHKNESLLIRKPLSPVSSQVLSKANIDNFLEDQKTIYTASSLVGTPSKPIAVGDEESRTPKTMPIPVPTTPPTVLSVPMTTARTPATPCLALCVDMAENNNQPTEYSFEEVRAGFILPKTYTH
jgi:protein regulator of cytokinesis 1